jgi:chemotaxis protein histidine kinase CheA
VTSLQESLHAEALEYLEALSAIAVSESHPDAPAMRRLTRALRGTAQMAGRDAALAAARTIETAAAMLADGSLEWSDEVRDQLARSLGDVRSLFRGIDSADGEPDAWALAGGWRELGVAPAPERTETADTEGSPDSKADAFRAYLADEVDEIAQALADGVAAFVHDPMDREALRAILRRQRALLGSARLDEFAAVAETLRAVEDLTRVIARMNVPVKDEWLQIYRSARDILQAASDPVRDGREPPFSPPLSRLRTLRDELLERYGSTDDESESTPPIEALLRARPAPILPVTASQDSALPPVEAAENPSEVASPVLEIDELAYDPSTALERARELRPILENALGSDRAGLEALDELFDLIRLALG